MKATPQEAQKINEQMNFPWSNFKDINYTKFMHREWEYKTFEVWYWITYIWCRPKYNKELVTIK